MKNQIRDNNEKILLKKLELLNKKPNPNSADEYMAEISSLQIRISELDAIIEAGASDSEILKLQEEILTFLEIVN